MDFRGQSERIIPSMCDVNKGLHMTVCVKRTSWTSSRVAPQVDIHPVPAVYNDWDRFFIPKTPSQIVKGGKYYDRQRKNPLQNLLRRK